MSQTMQSQQRKHGAQHSDAEEGARELLSYLEQFARENPQSAALWAFGIGFVLGWRLKPW